MIRALARELASEAYRQRYLYPLVLAMAVLGWLGATADLGIVQTALRSMFIYVGLVTILPVLLRRFADHVASTHREVTA